MGSVLRLPLRDENAAHADHRADGDGPGHRFVQEDYARPYCEDYLQECERRYPGRDPVRWTLC